MVNNVWKSISIISIILVVLLSNINTVSAVISNNTDIFIVEPVKKDSKILYSTGKYVKEQCENEITNYLPERNTLKDNFSLNRIVIRLKENVDFTVDSLMQNISIKSYKYNRKLGFVTVDLSGSTDVNYALGLLKNNPMVEYAGPSYRAKTIGSYDDNDYEAVPDSVYDSVYSSNDPYNINGLQWGITVTEMVYAWEMANSENIEDIVIAVIDTGVDYNHPDLAESIVRKNDRVLGYDFVNGDSDPFDDNGHGTHVAGIAAAVKDNGIGIAGVASGAKIMPIKVLDANGLGWSDHIADGIMYAVQNGADIINLSLGVAADEPYLYESIRYARSQGVVIIAACGGGSQVFSYPSEYPEVIAVGATDQDNNLCGFSGLDSDLVAPGNRIVSTYPIEIDVLDGIQDGYTYYSGTSMAAPFVSGLAAIILSSAKDVQYDRFLKDMKGENRVSKIAYYLLKGTCDFGDEGFDKYYGSGIINAKKLMENPLYKTTLENYDTNMPYNVPVEIAAYNYMGELNEAFNNPVTVKIFDNRRNLVNETVTDFVYGHAYAELEVTDVGKYGIVVQDEDDKRSRKTFEEFLYINPEAPYASLDSGTYTGSQKITLSTRTEGAFIYYTLDGSEPSFDSISLAIPSIRFESVIQIDRNTTVKAISYKNGAVSSVSTYNYTIIPEAINPEEEGNQGKSEEEGKGSKPEVNKGGSSGAGNSYRDFYDSEVPAASPNFPSVVSLDGHYAKTIVAVSDNRKKMLIKTSSDSLSLSAENADTVEINVSSEEKISEYEFHLTKEFISKLASGNKSLKLTAEGIAITIGKDRIVSNNNKGMELYLKRIPFDQVYSGKMVFGARPLSDVYDFKMFADGIEVLDFSETLTAEIGIGEKTENSINKAAVYYFNENKMKWDHVVGRIGKDSAISFIVNAPSAYVVMEYDKTFKDIENHWAKEYIESLASRQIVMGIDDSRFLPDDNVNRAQFITMLVSALGIEEEIKDVPFTDIDNAWYTEAVNNAYAAGIIRGTDEKIFSPDRNITREEMATILIQSLEYYIGNNVENLMLKEPKEFTDEKDISDWASEKILDAYRLDLLRGYEDGTFKPKSFATRAEAAVCLNRLLDILGLI